MPHNLDAARRRSSRFALLALLALVAALAGAYWLGRAHREPAAPVASASGAPAVAPPGRIAVVGGVTTVTVDPSVQKESGIEVAPLSAGHREVTSLAYGTVLDPLPLFALRERLAAAQAEQDAAQAAMAAANAEFERNRLLYADDRNVSRKALETARAAALAARSRTASAKAAQRGLEAEAATGFGGVLRQWLTQPAAPALARLRDGRAALVRVTLPADAAGPPPATAQITAGAADAAPAIAARLLSASTRSDPAVQGRAFLYLAEAALPSGAHVSVRLADDQGPAGVMMPADAIVWYGGQPWVYVQADATRFQRRRVAQTAPENGGFFVTDGFKPGQRVVVGGAQLLLSEESRAQLSAAGAGDDD